MDDTLIERLVGGATLRLHEPTPREIVLVHDCAETYGDAIERQIVWTSGKELSSLAGKPVRLRFIMKDADLYAYRFR